MLATVDSEAVDSSRFQICETLLHHMSAFLKVASYKMTLLHNYYYLNFSAGDNVLNLLLDEPKSIGKHYLEQKLHIIQHTN